MTGFVGARVKTDMKIFWSICTVLFLTECTWPSDVDRAYDQHLTEAYFKRISVRDLRAQPWAAHVERNILQMVMVNGSAAYVFYDTRVCHCVFIDDQARYLQVRELARVEDEKTRAAPVYMQ